MYISEIHGDDFTSINILALTVFTSCPLHTASHNEESQANESNSTPLLKKTNNTAVELVALAIEPVQILETYEHIQSPVYCCSLPRVRNGWLGSW